MNIRFNFILLICVLFSLISLNGKAQDLITDLISVWELNETSGSVADDALCNYNGTYNGIDLNKEGILGKCIYTNTSDYINVGNSTDFDGGDAFTVSAWVKTSTANYSKGLMVRDDGSNYKWILYVTGGSYVQLYVRTASGVKYSSNNVKLIHDGQWHHIVGVWDRYASDGFRIKCYIDGVKDSYGVGNNEPVTAGTISTYIGRWGLNYAFTGNIDQVAFWHGRALSPIDINTLYNNGLGLAYNQWSGIPTPLSAGSISPETKTITSGEDPGIISDAGLASGGTGAITTTWEVSTNNGSLWTVIPNQDGNSYDPGTLSQNTWYRRGATDNIETKYSNNSQITVTVPGGTGTVTSVGLASSDLTITGTNPITSSGTFIANLASGSVDAVNLNNNIISGRTALSSGLSPTDAMFISDGGILKRMDVSVLESYLQSTLQPWDNNQTYINYSGKVGINVSAYPTGDYSLAVNGKIKAKEVMVELTGWADYVFDSNYNLKTLEEIESFIQKNKHLPEVPSAKEVEANGLRVGEMNMLLLKKVEELTLYIISQQKEIKKLKKSVEIINK